MTLKKWKESDFFRGFDSKSSEFQRKKSFPSKKHFKVGWLVSRGLEARNLWFPLINFNRRKHFEWWTLNFGRVSVVGNAAFLVDFTKVNLSGACFVRRIGRDWIKPREESKKLSLESVSSLSSMNSDFSPFPKRTEQKLEYFWRSFSSFSKPMQTISSSAI